MKIFVYVLIATAAGLCVFNMSLLNADALFEGDSLIAAIGVLASACVIALLLILQTSLKIKSKQKR
ncbi:MAG: hypothetical protein ACKVGT_05740 [Flavobacteriales bacterium]|nr:hypothetical protein [Ulvibacter sp.]|tara:strand:+ start:1358 stop:1555 length:198 start_codon:yes stop_codon:yes gene_type:complete